MGIGTQGELQTEKKLDRKPNTEGKRGEIYFGGGVN